MLFCPESVAGGERLARNASAIAQQTVLACCKTLASSTFLQSAGAWAARSCGMMRVTLMGIALAFSSRGALAMDDSSIRTAVDAWLSNPAAAEATYGHISTWETGGVTDMMDLFCGYSYCSCRFAGTCAAAASFNEDIGAWDTSGVTTMWRMFSQNSAFNQDIGGWAVHSVTSMYSMFYQALAFNQDLGWCVGDDVDLGGAFSGTQCEPTSCGVRCPIKENDKEQIPVALIACLTVAVPLLAIGAFWFYRRRKASKMDRADEPSGPWGLDELFTEL